jgi:hypothetical protein
MSGDTTLQPHGGYRRQRSFQVIEIACNGRVALCDRFADKPTALRTARKAA